MDNLILAQVNTMTTANWVALGITVILLVACVAVFALMVRWVLKNLFK